MSVRGSDVSKGDTGGSSAAKKCRYCGCWSTSPCPWPVLGTLLHAWDPHLPWARGKPSKVIGDKCKLCQIVALPKLGIVFFLLDRSVVSNHRVVHNDSMIFDLLELVCVNF